MTLLRTRSPLGTSSTLANISNRIYSFSIDSHSLYHIPFIILWGLDFTPLLCSQFGLLWTGSAVGHLWLSFSVLPCHKEQGSGNAIKGACRCAIDCSRLSATLSYQRVSPISRRSMPSFPSSAALQHRSWKCHKGFVETLYQMIGRLEKKAPWSP